MAAAIAGGMAALASCSDDAAPGAAGDGGASLPDGQPAVDGQTPIGDGGDAGDGGGPVDVSGKIVYRLYGRPAANATVKIGNATTTTAADGTFSVAGVEAPYLASVTYTNGPVTSTFTVDGLTTAAPWFELPVVDRTSTFVNASIDGTVTRPGGFPLPEDHMIVIVGASRAAGVYYTEILGGAATGDFDLGVSLFDGPPTYATSIYALEYVTTDAGPAASWTGYAKAIVSSMDGGTPIPLTLDLAPVSHGSATVAIQNAANADVTYSAVSVLLDRTVAMDVPTPTTGGAVTFPTLPNAVPVQFTRATFDGGVVSSRTARLTDAGAFVLDLGAPFTALPAEGATLTPTTTFSWTAPPGSVVALEVRNETVTQELLASYYTTASSVTWPGPALPPGNYSWRAVVYRDVPTTDALAVERTLWQGHLGNLSLPWRAIVVP